MPRYGPQVKAEPLSDEEDTNSHLVSNFATIQHPGAIKLETQSDENVPSHLLHHLQVSDGLAGLAELAPAAPAATPAPMCVKQEPGSPPHHLETLESTPHKHAHGSALLERHLALLRTETQEMEASDFMPLISVKDEAFSEGELQHLSGEDTSDSASGAATTRSSPKSWNQKDMDNALDALRTHNMTLTKASATYGIPSTTLWQRAHRLGIDTPKKEGGAKSWSEADLKGALQALRQGAISANKASKAYGIPSSTLYKIARREGIRLAAPFNAAPTTWRRDDLQRALHSIRCGAASVQRAASQYGIPTGTLYGRCKREGIELSRSNPTPWSEDAMGEALEAVRVGQMSINQAAIHYNLPYSSLYGRFKRCKYQIQGHQIQQQSVQENLEMEHPNQTQEPYYHPHHDVEQTAPYLQHVYTEQDTSMHGSVLLHGQSHTNPAMYYVQGYNNGIATS